MAEYSYEPDEFFGDGVPETPPASTAPVEESTAQVEDVAPAAPAPPPTTPADQPVTLSPDVSKLLARERLQTVEGESDATALRRLYDHQRQRADRLYYEEVKGAKSEARAAREALEALKRDMDPLFRAFNERRAEAEAELAKSQVPEEGTAEYLQWQQQQIISRMDEREKREAEAQAAAEEEARTNSVLTIDETAQAELAQAIQTDQEAREAYALAVRVGLKAARRSFPDAPDDKIEELVMLSHILEMRNAKQRGVPVAELFKQRRLDIMEEMGVVNGHQAPAAPAPAPVSRTARELTAASAKAQARAVVSPTPPAASVPSGDGTDFGQMDEDSLMEYILSSDANAAEYYRWVENKHAKSTWR